MYSGTANPSSTSAAGQFRPHPKTSSSPEQGCGPSNSSRSSGLKKTVELSLALGGILRGEPVSIVVAHRKMSFPGCGKRCPGYQKLRDGRQTALKELELH